MTATISFHGPYTYRGAYYPPGSVEGHPGPYSVLIVADGRGSEVSLYFPDRDALAALAGAVTAAHSQWPAPQPEPGPVPDGHGENHIGNAGQVVYTPGDCITCHGHVDAGGVFHVAGAA